jgi:glutamyl-tRNA synthetase
VPNGRSFKLAGEHRPEVELKNHPDEPLGNRKVGVKENVWLPKEDSKEGSEIRLKDFCNVAIEGDSARITSFDVKPIPKVQWIGNGAQSCELLLPDGSTLSGLIEPNPLPVGSMAQLERFGFVRIERWDGSGVAAVFAHK